MPERIQLTGPPEQAAAQLWAHIQEKTMLNGEHLPKFDSPEKAADVYLEHLTREELEKVIKDLITTLQKNAYRARRHLRKELRARRRCWQAHQRKNLLTAPARFGNQRHDRATEAYGRSLSP